MGSDRPTSSHPKDDRWLKIGKPIKTLHSVEVTTISPKLDTDWNDEELYQAVGIITRQFPLLKCHECAIAIRSWLSRRKIPNKIWKISTQNPDEDFILSDRLEQQGITDSITDNGIHYGIEVRGKIFDNLSPEGMTLEEWVQDFHSISDEFDVISFEDPER